MKFVIGDDIVDQLVMDSLKVQIKVVKKSIKQLKKTGTLEYYQQEDLANDVVVLDALQKVYDYFNGGWSE